MLCCRRLRARAAEWVGRHRWSRRDVPAMGAEAWFGWMVGGTPEPPFEPAEQPQFADLLEQVVTSAGRLVGVPDVLLYLVEPGEHGGRRLVVRCGIGCFVTSVGRSVGMGQGLAGEVWRIGAPLTVDEYQTWPRRLRGDRGENGICGALAAPVRSDGEVVGVLGVASNRPGRVFGEAEIELLCRLGELAGVAQSEARYRIVFDTPPTVIYTVSLHDVCCHMASRRQSPGTLSHRK